MNIHEYQAKELLAKFGVAIPLGFAAMSVDQAVEAAKRLCQADFASEDGNWCVIFNEEAFETMGAKSTAELLPEQVQAAAVLAAWWECARHPGHAW